jgi:hypothetical protein
VSHRCFHNWSQARDKLADFATENIAFLIKYREIPNFDPRYVDVISFSDTDPRDSTDDLRKYVVVLTHGKDHVNIVEALKKIYEPLEERIRSRKTEKGKSATGRGTARVKKSRDIVVPDPDSDREKESVLVQAGSDVNNRAFI